MTDNLWCIIGVHDIDKDTGICKKCKRSFSTGIFLLWWRK